MWFKYGLKAQKLLAQGAWSKLAYIWSIEALSTVQVARFTISVFEVSVTLFKRLYISILRSLGVQIVMDDR